MLWTEFLDIFFISKCKKKWRNTFLLCRSLCAVNYYNYYNFFILHCEF